MREEKMVGGAKPANQGMATGRVPADDIAGAGFDIRLIERDPTARTVGQTPGDEPGELREAMGRLAATPAATIFERLKGDATTQWGPYPIGLPFRPKPPERRAPVRGQNSA